MENTTFSGAVVAALLGVLIRGLAGMAFRGWCLNLRPMSNLGRLAQKSAIRDLSSSTIRVQIDGIER
jgi:hypothetical protein